MRIAVVHNEYQQRGGEDVAVEQQVRALRSAGHDVAEYRRQNTDIRTTLDRVRVALTTPYSLPSYLDTLRFFESTRPNIVHVHNTFPLIGPAVFQACHKMDIPCVVTLHNYRLTCSNGMLLRNGRPCELCIKGTPFYGVAFGCFRESRLATLPVATMISLMRGRRSPLRHVGRFIALTSFARTRFVDAGIPNDRIEVIPNFYDGELSERHATMKASYLFVGRLSHEKGVMTLLSAFRSRERTLRVVGDGPLLRTLQQNATPNVTVLGALSREGVIREMQAARALVFPSQWYEGFPMVLVEAFAMKLPVIASRIGSVSEIVEDGINGTTFSAGSPTDLLRALEWFERSPHDVANRTNAAFRKYSELYCREQYLRRLMCCYDSLLGG